MLGESRLNTNSRNKQGKWILRELLYKYVPKALIDKPKSGFGVPIEYWLKGPLLDWAENLLDENELKKQGFFDSTIVREMWDEHIKKESVDGTFNCGDY